MPSAPLQIIEALPGHIPHLAAFMRAADRVELTAAQNARPHEALSQSLALSTRAWCALVGGKPSAIWGVGAARTALSHTGAPWLMATDGFHALRRPFLRFSRKYVELMHEDFPRLENYVHAKNHASIRWLAWCGFSLAERPEPYGPFNEPFYRFWRQSCAM